MAVQAQYPSNAFIRDFRNRLPNNNALEELQMLQGRDNLIDAYAHLGPQILNNGTVFSDPESELTCNASGSRKRNRDEAMQQNQNQQQEIPLQFRYPNLNIHSFPLKTDPTVSSGVHLSQQQHARLLESAGTSTSGRPSTVSVASSTVTQDLVSHFYQQNLEIDTFVRLQCERLRCGLEEARKRHCRALITVLEEQVGKKLREKDIEIENANRRNAELEEKVRQLSSDNQIWFNVAKNNEAIASSLKTSLEQVLLQNAVTANTVQVKEGYGDSHDTPFPADDAHSVCFEEQQQMNATAVYETTAALNGREEEVVCRKVCKVCCNNDMSVLLLPCRHLCLCIECESKVDKCPICQCTKNACLQIFMS